MREPALINELEKAISVFNHSLFDNKLEPIKIALQTKRKVSLKWVPELESLVIGSEFISIGVSEIPGILLHELIHISNYQRGIVDVTTNQYHNKNFLQLALDVGLVVIKHKTQGWAITSTFYPRNVVDVYNIKRPSKDAITKRNTAFGLINLDKNSLKESRNEIRDRVKLEKPPKTYFLKYECQCPPPHNSIRSGRRPDGRNALNIQCLDCQSNFECVTDLDE